MDDKNVKLSLMVVGMIFLVSLIVLVNVIIGNELKKSNFIGLDSDHLRTIRVTGEGKTYAVPDTASISFSVLTSDESSEIALNENNKKAEAVVNFLKQQGIEKKNIQTTGVRVRPVYDWSPERTEYRRIASYEVTNRIEVEFDDLEKINTVIDGSIRAGANRVDSFQFLISDQEELRAEAKAKAIQQAREKARKTTFLLGVRLGRVIDFSETRDYYMPPMMREAAMDVIETDMAPEMPIEPGENEIIVNVTIEYEII